MVYAVPSALMLVATPMLSKAVSENKGKLIEVLNKVIIIAGVLSAFWLVAGYFGSDLIINTLFGERYAQAGGILKILVFANTAAFFASIYSYMMAVMDKQNRFAFNQGIVLTVSFLLNLIFIYQKGAYGAAWAVLFTQLSILALSMISVTREIRKR